VLRECCRAAPASLAWKIGPSGACLTMRPRLTVIRATATNRLDVRVLRESAAKQRRGRSGRLRTRFTPFAVTPLKVAARPHSLSTATTDNVPSGCQSRNHHNEGDLARQGIDVRPRQEMAAPTCRDFCNSCRQQRDPCPESQTGWIHESSYISSALFC